MVVSLGAKSSFFRPKEILVFLEIETMQYLSVLACANVMQQEESSIAERIKKCFFIDFSLML